ncbi:MAG: transglycosylase SLT domain-containing protein [Bacteroidales bacterium]|nr:transglycosylase SLT domain-containing protein [Bacteroidales bacterium]
MAAFFVGQPLGAQNPSKKQLAAENIELKAKLDSLRDVVSAYERAAFVADSVARAERAASEEMMDMEENSKVYLTEDIDSLLSAWYDATELDFTTEGENLDSVVLGTDIPDSVYVRRLQDMRSFIPIEYNDIVRNYIILYSEKRKSSMTRVLGLGRYYMPIFEEALRRYDLPLELRALSIVESFLNPTATSRVGAKGLWQFMPVAARHYGLQIDSFVDERMDPVKSSDAAARHLKDAYRVFGDWNIAIASYNCGPGNIRKAMKRSGKSDFWGIYSYLPRETRGYVPAFIGALYVLNYYRDHGIVPADMPIATRTDTIKVTKMLAFKQINDVAGIPSDVVKSLNPQYYHDIIPGKTDKPYILKLPYKYTDSFIEVEDSVYKYQADSLFSPTTIKKITDGMDGERIVYVVKSGDSLGRIASKYHCTVSQIKKWNGLRSDMIRIGQKITVYRGGKH